MSWAGQWAQCSGAGDVGLPVAGTSVAVDDDAAPPPQQAPCCLQCLSTSSSLKQLKWYVTGPSHSVSPPPLQVPHAADLLNSCGMPLALMVSPMALPEPEDDQIQV